MPRHPPAMIGKNARQPQEIVDKIMFQHSIFGHQRFLAQIGIGSMPHAKIMQAIELLGSHVAPAVRKAIGKHKL